MNYSLPGFYNDIQEAAAHIIDVLSGILQVNTIFVATNDGVDNLILNAFNRKETLVTAGDVLSYEISYCSLVLNHTSGALIISDTLNHPLTRDLTVTRNLGNHSFTGVPIRMKNGIPYGTLCILDTPSAQLSQSDLKTLKAMALFLGYVVEQEHNMSLKDQKIHRTEQLTKQLEKEKMLAEVSAVNKLKLLGMMSNEIRIPLTEIWGITDLMRTTELTEEQLAYLDIMEASSHSLMTLLNNIMVYSKNETGQVDDVDDPFDLTSMIENGIKPFRAKIAKKNLELILNLELEESEIYMGDEAKIRRVLTSLLSNAVAFTNTGSITIAAKTIPMNNEMDVLLQLSVKDTGVGIDTDKLQRLFVNHLHPSDISPAQSYHSLGLGLPITLQILKMVNGQISAVSEPGVGTEMNVTITLKKYNTDMV